MLFRTLFWQKKHKTNVFQSWFCAQNLIRAWHAHHHCHIASVSRVQNRDQKKNESGQQYPCSNSICHRYLPLESHLSVPQTRQNYCSNVAAKAIWMRCRVEKLHTQNKPNPSRTFVFALCLKIVHRICGIFVVVLFCSSFSVRFVN